MAVGVLIGGLGCLLVSIGWLPDAVAGARGIGTRGEVTVERVQCGNQDCEARGTFRPGDGSPAREVGVSDHYGSVGEGFEAVVPDRGWDVVAYPLAGSRAWVTPLLVGLVGLVLVVVAAVALLPERWLPGRFWRTVAASVRRG